MKKHLVFLAIAILLILSLVACGQSEQDAEQIERRQAVYLAEQISVFHDGYYPMTLGTPFLFDGRIHVPYIGTGIRLSDEHVGESEQNWQPFGGSLEWMSEISLGGERRVVGVDAFYGEDFFTIPVFELVAINDGFPMNDYLALHPFAAGDVVRILAVEMGDYYETGDIHLLASIFSEDGDFSLRFYRLNTMLARLIEQQIDPALFGEGQFVADAWFDADGNVLLLTFDGQTQAPVLTILDPTLTRQLARLDANFDTTLVRGRDGQMWGVEMSARQGARTTLLHPLNPSDWTWGEAVSLPIYDVFGLYAAPIESEFTWFVHTEFGLYGITAEGIFVEYFSWLDKDVLVTRESTLIFLADGEIIVLNEKPHPFFDAFLTFDSVLLRRAGSTVTDEREILTIGGVNLHDSTLFELVRRFNRESETHRAVIVDYAEAGWEGAPMRLRTELMVGEGPDVVLFDQWGDENDISHALMRGGFLADLHPFLANDPHLSREDFFANILDIWTNEAGELALITGAVLPTPFWGASEHLTEFDDFTHEGFLAFLWRAEAQGMPYPMGANFLPFVVLQNMLFADNTFFCYATGQANFDSKLFLDILAYADSIPDDRQARWMEMIGTGEAFDPISFMARGEQLLTRMLGIITVDDFRRFDAAVGGLTPIGAPNAAGELAISTRPIRRMGIRANSPNAEAAWEFIRLDLLYPNVAGIAGLPTKRDLFEAYIHEALAEGPRYWGDEMELPAFTEDRAAVLRLIMEHITHEYHPNPYVMAILWEETSSFFAGDRTAEDTVRIVQNRVSTYLAERS